MSTVMQDLRYAIRVLGRAPGFALTAILTIALGIGANTAMFSLINVMLLRPPRFAHLDRQMMLFDVNKRSDTEVNPSPANFLDWREQSHSFDYMVAWRNWYYTLGGPESGAGVPESVRGVRVSPAFFSMLGINAALGRTFGDDEERPGSDQSVILSNSLWQRRFGGEPGIVGQKVLVDGHPLVVVGVLPPDFYFLQPDFELWLPLPIDAPFHDRQDHSVMVFARLATGVSVATAQAEMKEIGERLGAAYPETNRLWGVRVVPLYPSRYVQQDVQPALLVLLGAVGFVLLIASANVANLLLARAVTRERELAVRNALGATRGRLIRQMLTESVLLSLLGGAAGLVLAYWGLRILVPLLPRMPTFRAVVPTIDTKVLGFTAVVALVTGIAFGLIPAFQATKADLLRVSALSQRRVAAGRFLIVLELGLSIVLLVGAALLLESLWQLQAIDPGFRPDHLLTMQVWLPKARYPESAKVSSFYRDVVHRIESLPGVRGASAVNFRPFVGMGVGTRIEIDGRPPEPGVNQTVGYRVVTPGHLRLMGVSMLKGRDLAESDDIQAGGVVVINQAMAQRFWPNEDPIGRHVKPTFAKTSVPWVPDATSRSLTVVGIVGNMKQFRVNEPPAAEMYLSSLQFPSSFMFLLVRSVTPPTSMVGSVQNEVHAVDPDQPVSDVRTMESAIEDAVSQPRLNVRLLVLFAGLALLLSAGGVYGVTSYAITQRTQEIGTRMALGARARDVIVMVISEVLVLAAIATIAGLAGAIALARTMRSALYGVAPTNLVVLVSAAAVLLGVTVLACYLPARRAARLDPMTALRI